MLIVLQLLSKALAVRTAFSPVNIFCVLALFYPWQLPFICTHMSMCHNNIIHVHIELKVHSFYNLTHIKR